MAASLSLDFETASCADLKRTGSYLYAKHPSTLILCMSYAFDDENVQTWWPWLPFPQRIIDHIAAGGVLRAWNAAFELDIWNQLLIRLHPEVPALLISQVRDTMAQAAYYGLPLGLDMASQAVGLNILKDKAGHALMMRMCKPRGFNPDGTPIWWHLTDPLKYTDLGLYCVKDVEAERAIARYLPELPDAEQRVWARDRAMNLRGVGVDLQLVDAMQGLAKLAQAQANQDMAAMTGGFVPTVTSTAKLQQLLGLLGYPHDNLRKDTVAARLDEPDCGPTETLLLELRSEGAKTSAAKLQRMVDATDLIPGLARGVVRGMLQYYGAFRTGRWAGRLIQLQNMPRGELKPKQIAEAIDLILRGATPAQIVAALGVGALRVVSSLLRSCIIARVPGRVLVVADFAQIEARVIAWLAGQDDILAVFASGRDVYIYTAEKVTGRLGITKDSPLRQLGKVLVLACGFGMSGPKFKDTAATYGITLTEPEAVANVAGWRQANDKITAFWWALDQACKDVLSGAASQVKVGDHILVGMWGQTLVIRLPSGRGLFYREARLEADDQGRPGITYMGLDQYTKKWKRLRTYGGKLAENVTQAVARDVMADAMGRIEAEAQYAQTDLDLLLTIHDELIGDAPDAQAQAALDLMQREMRKAPAWAPGLPVGSDGWHGARYKK